MYNIWIIVFIFLLFLIITLLSLLIYLIFSKKRKILIKKRKKEAKLKYKEIIAKAYKEIKIETEKLEDNIEKQKKKNTIELENIKNEKKFLKVKQTRLDNLFLDLEKRTNWIEEKNKEIITHLEEISGLSKQEAKELLFQKVEERNKKRINNLVKESEIIAHTRSKIIADEIIVSAIERMKINVVNERTTNIVKLPNDEIKGRIIGRDGRNIKMFEQLGGVELIIDSTPGVVTVSCFDPIRREIATRTLENLIIDGRIQPNSIEKELEKQKKEINNIILETGSNTVKELGIYDMHIELVRLLGILKFRTSYGQNALIHSIEVAQIASNIAGDLKLDSKLALRAGLLHDIGKAVDFEEEGSHVTLGVLKAKQYGENDVVINAIESHHEDVEKDNIISAIVSVADAVSASRPGARNNDINDFLVRMSEIEKIGNSIAGVTNTYAFQSGRQIRVIVDPLEIDDNKMIEIVEIIREEIKKNVIIPGDITVTVVREKKETLTFNKIK